MKNLLLIVFLTYAGTAAAQNVYTIKADSVKITGCDSSELIIENHSQAVKGFLYNTGNGRTVFKKGIEKVNGGLYLVGADSLNLGASVWMQGGNAFGGTGVLGTMDNNAMDLYTNGQDRARLAANGNLMIGDSTDNGRKLQVTGDASFTGNVGIGTATITNTGSLIGTNAILFNHFMPRFHNYSHTSPYIGKLDDVLYNYDGRLNTTYDYPGDGSLNIHIVFPPDELTTQQGIVYAGGRMYFSFWDNGLPQQVSVSVMNWTGSWIGPSTSSTNLNTGGSGLYMVTIPGINWLTEIKVTITPLPGGFVNLQNMEYVLETDEEGLTNPHPYVSKYGEEHIYNHFYLKYGGIDNVRLSPYPFQPSYFMNHVLVGSKTIDNGASLQVTGDMTTTGGVKLGGLTNSNAQTRVVVSDADGNLYYRDASTLAANDILRSSLAVNGPLRARSLTLSDGAGTWPDYVFDSSYRLEDLREVERYLHEHHHLPGVASAEEIAGKGLNVGENQAVLLKKIEELTLYAIGLEKKLGEEHELNRQQTARVDAQSAEMEMLRKEMADLRKMIMNKPDKK